MERLPNWHVPSWMQSRDVAVYGEPLFASLVAEALSLALLEPPFEWLTTVPSEYLRRRVEFMTLDEARQHRTRAFIKPADDKCFAAAVYDSGAKLSASEAIPDTTPVLVAEPAEWDVEFRCFVLDGVVKTLSPYWRDGRTAQAEDGSWPASSSEVADALSFAATVLHNTTVPPAVVLDVGIIRDRGWAVVECNAAFGSGLYGCDPAHLLPVLHRACVKSTALSEADRRWVVARAEA